MTGRGLIPAALAVAVVVAALGLWLMPAQGRQAPDIAMETLSGERIQLTSLEGKPVMLQFWATTCTTCVAEIPHLKDLHRKLSDKGLRLVAIAMPYDPPEQVRRMAHDKGIPYTVALDREGTVTQAFGDVRLTPTTILIDAKGRIAWKRQGKLDFEQLEADIKRRVETAETS
jgi:peroxiredoxin